MKDKTYDYESIIDITLLQKVKPWRFKMQSYDIQKKHTIHKKSP